jgi:hypothetical protein
MGDLTDTQNTSLLSILTNFSDYFNSFQSNFQGLLAQANYVVSTHPELKPEYDSLVNTASINYTKLVNIKNTLDSIKNTGTSISNWFKNALGLSSLGIVPLVIAGMSAAAVYGLIVEISKWLQQTKTFAAKLEFLKAQEAKGYSPDQAASAANKIYGEPDTEQTFLGLPIKWVIVGAVLIILGPPLINAFTKK